MQIPGLRSSYDMVGGLVFFGRMLDKIRVHAQERLPADYNRGSGFDGRTCRFLNVEYEQLVFRVLQGGTDEEILGWCHQHGRRPSEEEIIIWNAFMTKRGWRDDVSEWLAEQKRLRGWEHRDDIQTAFDFHAATHLHEVLRIEQPDASIARMIARTHSATLALELLTVTRLQDGGG